MGIGRIGNWLLLTRDVVTGKLATLKSKNGALQVDLCELENVQIQLPDGTALGVEVQNIEPIPVDLPAEKVVDVEVQNTVPIPVDLPAEKVVDVEVQNTAPIPVDLPAERVVDVEVANTSPIPVDLPAEKVVDVEVQNTAPIPVDLPTEKVVDVEVQNTDPIPVEVEFRTPAGQTVQVPSGASSSASFEVGGIEAFGVGVPYGTEGASLGIWVSMDDTNWFLLPEVLPFVADQAGVNYACNTAGVGLMELLAPWTYCKLQTLDSAGDAQVQASNRDFVVVMR